MSFSKLSFVFACAGFCLATTAVLASDKMTNGNCLSQNVLAQNAHKYGELGKIYQLASRGTMGRFLTKRTNDNPFDICLLDNAKEEIAFVQDQKIFLNPGNESLSVIKNPKKKRAFIALLALEEYAHAQMQRSRPSGAYKKHEMVNYQLSDAISATFVDEAVAASAAVLIALQQHQNGQSELWDTLKEDWNPYKYIAIEMEKKAQETSDMNLVHLEGAKIWMRIPFFTVRYAGQTIGSYKWHFDKEYKPYARRAGFKKSSIDDLRSYGAVFGERNVFDSVSDENLQGLTDNALNLAVHKGGPHFLFALKRTERRIQYYNKTLSVRAASLTRPHF